MGGFFVGLVTDGFLPVFLALLHHLPTVVVLLTVVSLFEHSGFALGFSCTTLAIGTLDKNADPLYKRRMTRFLTFIPCAAKAPVLLFLLTLMGLSVFLVVALYIFALAIGIILGGNHVVRCPKFKRMTFNQFVWGIFLNIIEFLKRISIGLILAVAVLYTLQYLGWLLPMAEFIQPLFAPIGLTAPLIVALLFGLIAKEMIIGVVVAFGVASLGLTTAIMSSFIVFVLLYTTCFPSLMAIRAKLGFRYACKIAALNFAVAYIAALIVFNVAVIIAL